MKVLVYFTKDFETKKKGETAEHSKDIAKILVEELKVASYEKPVKSKE